MIRVIITFLIGILVSFYFFPISFTFLPNTLNTKMLLAVLGVLCIAFECIKRREIAILQGVLGAASLALLFSLICFISTDINHTYDYSYASYIVSFSVWMSAAYAIYCIIKGYHGIVNFRILTLYLAGVCLFQCIAAVMIDNIPAFQIAVNSYVNQGQEFFEDVDRLYGIGAALDPAGVRFSLVLIMIAGLLCVDEVTRKNSLFITFLLIAFFTIAVIGNAISRTTIIGLALASFYFVASSGLFQVIVKFSAIKLGITVGIFFTIAILASIYFYNTSNAFHDYMRFAFEGFFNWAENGEWRTDSTDKLNREMWVWPTNLQTWVIGSGRFDGFIYSTDIGYCRFILYSGIVGFSAFVMLFVYNALYFAHKNPKYKMLFFMFLILTFVIWFKVATDIFTIYALFFCLDSFDSEPSPSIALQDENSI